MNEFKNNKLVHYIHNTTSKKKVDKADALKLHTTTQLTKKLYLIVGNLPFPDVDCAANFKSFNNCILGFF